MYPTGIVMVQNLRRRVNGDSRLKIVAMLDD